MVSSDIGWEDDRSCFESLILTMLDGGWRGEGGEGGGKPWAARGPMRWLDAY